MESMVAPSDFGIGALELKAAIRKVVVCIRVAHISESKEILGHFKILELRPSSRGAF